MAAFYALSALLVFLGVGYLSADVLVKTAAQDDVDRLSAAANAKERQILLERRRGEIQFEITALGFDRAEARKRFLAVITGMDIEVAAAQDKAIKARQQAVQRYARWRRRQD